LIFTIKLKSNNILVILTNKLWLTELKVLYLADFKSIKACNEILNSGWFSLIIVISGKINFIEGSSNIHLSAGDMSIVPSLAHVSDLGLPLRICLVSCTLDFAIINRVERFGIEYTEVMTNQLPFVLSLEEAEISYMVQLFGLLKKNFCGQYTIFQYKMVLLCIDLIFYAFSELYYKYGENKMVNSHNEKIVMSFIMLVQQNCRAHHDVKFYADSLFISKGHLRKLVRSVLGIPAKYFIEMTLISEAYSLLANDKLSITEVGEYLNFSSPSSFSHFFKRHTKLSPTQYRMTLKF
jgi:AraC family transcriptional activator of pobA